MARRQLTIFVVLVTHDLDVTLLLADNAAVLDAGQVSQLGPPAEVARHPAGLRVAWLLGTEAPRPVIPANGCAVAAPIGVPLTQTMQPRRHDAGRT